MDLDDRVLTQVRLWRDDLLSLTRSSNLLYFKHLKVGSLEITDPGPDSVFARLNQTRSPGWLFKSPADTKDDAKSQTEYVNVPDSTNANDNQLGNPSDALSTTKATALDLTASLRTLHRSSTQEFLDKGIWILYLGLGMLEWEDPDDHQTAHSPLLLVPVRLDRPSPRQPFRLLLTEGDPVINPALLLKLETDFGVTVPELDPEDRIDKVFATFSKVAELRPSWQVTSRNVLARFSFQKEVMYQDLRKNEEFIANHPLIAALATPAGQGETGRFSFDAVPENVLDEVVPPEEHPTVLDADATQRSCIEAAVRGATFIMDGPPGTGKSQTIANVIAELLRVGKRVLFVSEKAAALDVVTKRLSEAGLQDFLLPLYDQRAARREVAASLARSLQQRPEVQLSAASTDLEVLRNRRRDLSGYAAAMNEVRYPLGRSLHETIGLASALHDVPQAPVAEAVGVRVTAADFVEILEIAHRLSRAWGPIQRGDAFVWRDLENFKGTAASRQLLEGEVSDARNQLDALTAALAEVAAALALPHPRGIHDAQKILELLTLLTQRIVVPATWLTTTDLDAIERRIEQLRSLALPYQEAQQELLKRVGENWQTIVGAELSAAALATASLVRLHSAMNAIEVFGRDDLKAAEHLCTELNALAPQLLEVGRRVAEHFGLADETISIDRAEQLAQLGHFASAAHRPLRDWLNPTLVGALDEARDALHRAIESVKTTRTALSPIFEDSIIQLDLDGLSVRFATIHKGAGKLRKSYRDDKSMLVPHLKLRRISVDAVSALEAAKTWQYNARELDRAERKYAPLLGHYYEGADTDFAAIDEAIGVAKQSLGIVGREIEQANVVAALLQPDAVVVSDAQRIDELLKRGRMAAEQVATQFLTAFNGLPLTELARIAQEALPLLEQIRNGLEQVEVAATRSITVVELLTVASLVTECEQTRTAVNSHLPDDRELLGSDYRGVDSDWDLLGEGLKWTKNIRSTLGGWADSAQAQSLLTLSASPVSLEITLGAWRDARETLLTHFTEEHAGLLRSRLEVDFDDARLLLTLLSGTLDDVTEWAAFADSRAALIAAGMIEQVAFCENARVPASAVPGVFERSLLEGFIDATLQRDARLQNHRAIDRDSIVKEFRELDQRLFELASARVAQACNARRPRTTIGPAGIIMRESEKQRRHMPIRDLLATTADVAQSLKPCFVMSPLTVSQFLTPNLRFDTVIFDEASQVRPCDAINAIYRGEQVIVAGDQRQLPPTSFFARVDADETDEYEEGQFEEFQSVLDLCKGQGDFPSLPLSWHYRSRHESLITFSNYSFYDGRLITFPSAAPDGDDAGVSFFKVDGVYRRGGARDNPIEAEAVVDRVLVHARRHPKLSLGVVAFSEAQAAAIETAVDRRRRNFPELDYYFAEDRLNGFFVKNLESVQGDERDIVVFSVGYGPDELGKLHMNFGPLNKPGGQRRLNVAITRARQLVEIVSSVSAADFVSDTTNPGVRHLRRYLDFADRGIAALGLELGSEAKDTESPFEEEVARLLRSWGYDVVPQVGQSGYRIDLGIRDPRARGGFLLGVECDGFAYHSSKVARDRDRLRHEQLVAQGWSIHHIWGTAWYHQRAMAEQELRDAIDAALASGGFSSASNDGEMRRRSVEVDFAPVSVDPETNWTIPYKVADFTIQTRGHEITAPGVRNLLSMAVERVVSNEGPVHEDILIRRVREAWGVGRAGNRIRTTFQEVFSELAARGVLIRDRDGFLSLKGQEVGPVRVPVEGQPETARAIEHVALSEIAQAVLYVVREAKAVEQEELVRHIARIFGWRRTGDGIVARIGDAISRVIQSGTIERDGGRVRWMANEQSETLLPKD